MKANKKIRDIANKIISKYTKGFIPLLKMQEMYKELEDVGVTTGYIAYGNRSCEWYYKGELVENSKYVYSTYTNDDGSRVEVTAYMS